MCEIVALWRFQRSVGRVGDRTVSSSCLPCFPSDRHFHRCSQPCFRLETWSINSSRCFLIARLLAVGHHLRLVLAILLRFDKRQCMAKTFILDDSGVGDALVLTEDAIGK